MNHKIVAVNEFPIPQNHSISLLVTLECVKMIYNLIFSVFIYKLGVSETPDGIIRVVLTGLIRKEMIELSFTCQKSTVREIWCQIKVSKQTFI